MAFLPKAEAVLFYQQVDLEGLLHLELEHIHILAALVDLCLQLTLAVAVVDLLHRVLQTVLMVERQGLLLEAAVVVAV
jgi:hypothetical protein